MDNKKRDLYFDQLRGIAIVAVVLIHTTGTMTLFEKDNWNFQFLFDFRQILNFAVALFVFLSGYFLSQKKINNKKDYFVFLKKQLPKVLLPYLFYTTLLLVFGIFRNRNIDLINIITTYLTGSALGPYYYIIVIVQYYLLLPLLQKINNRLGFIISIAINSLFFILLYLCRFKTNANIPLFFYGGVFPSWIVFFQGGLFLGKYGIKKIDKKYAISLIIITLLLCFVEANIWLYETSNISYAISQSKFSSFLFSWSVIYFLISYRFSINNVLLQIGKYSFGIYLIHIIIMIFASKILALYPPLMDIQPLYQFLYLAITIGVSCMIIFSSKKIFPKWANSVFGFNQ